MATVSIALLAIFLNYCAVLFDTSLSLYIVQIEFDHRADLRAQFLNNMEILGERAVFPIVTAHLLIRTVRSEKSFQSFYRRFDKQVRKQKRKNINIGLILYGAAALLLYFNLSFVVTSIVGRYDFLGYAPQSISELHIAAALCAIYFMMTPFCIYVFFTLAAFKVCKLLKLNE